MEKLEVILKVAERCNINCTYCYVFNGVDSSYKHHSKHISLNTIKSLALFLQKACLENNLKTVQIDFHGGEPLIIGKTKFRKYCDIFRDYLEDITDLVFCLQTNSILIDDEWIDLFVYYEVKVSTSLDGPKHVNDIGRINFNGTGTYEQTLKGLKLLQKAYFNNRLQAIGVICVINPHTEASEIYNHFVNELNLDLLEFLLPDQTHDNFNSAEKGLYSNFLMQLFDSWVKDDNPNIKIRILNSAISLLLGGSSYVVGFGNYEPNAITISSDGDIGPDDILRSVGGNIMETGLLVFKNDFKEYLEHYALTLKKEISKSLNEGCKNCCWLKVCGANHPIHRFSKANGFSNKSVYCNDMKEYFMHISKYLLSNGLPLNNLKENLFTIEEN